MVLYSWVEPVNPTSVIVHWKKTMAEKNVHSHNKVKLVYYIKDKRKDSKCLFKLLLHKCFFFNFLLFEFLTN